MAKIKRNRVLIYARASTAKQETSTEDQVLICKRWVERKMSDTHGFRVLEAIEDKDTSGYYVPFESRDGGEEVMELAKAREFDTLVVYEITRLARRTEAGLRLVRILWMQYRIRVVCIAEGIDTAVKYDEAELAELFTRGQRERDILSMRVKSRVDLARFSIEEKGYYITKAGNRITELGNKERLREHQKTADRARWVPRRLWLLSIQPRLVAAARAVLYNKGGLSAGYQDIADHLNFEQLEYITHLGAHSGPEWSVQNVRTALRELKRMGVWRDQWRTRRYVLDQTLETTLAEVDVKAAKKRVSQGLL